MIPNSHPALIRRLTLIALAALIGCNEAPAADPLLRVGALGIPDGLVVHLAEPELQGLADLIAFGTLIRDGSADDFLAPLLERSVERTRIAALPLHLGARERALTEEDLRREYDRAPEPELRVRHIVRLVPAGASPQTVDEARALAEELAGRLARGEEFAGLAADFSEEPGAADRGGALQPGRRGSWVEEFWQAAGALEPGEVSGVVRTEYGFHIIRLDERSAVPFEEADRTELLRRLIPLESAGRAMDRWVVDAGGVLLDPPGLATAYGALQAGEAIPDTLPIAVAGRFDYRGLDLAIGWAGLDPERRSALERAELEGFARWVEEDARDVLWARAAAEIGVPPAPRARAEADLLWQGTIARLGQRFGLTGPLPDDRLALIAQQALLSGAPEFRAARSELRSLRPLLRRAYPVATAPR